MARDYKYRATQNRKKTKKTSVAWWKWSLIVVLISLFVFFLVFLSNSSPDTKSGRKTNSVSKQTKRVKHPPKHQNKKPEEPHFDFYTILPETEIIVPDYEINTRSREEQLGKSKTRKYIIQAGSFKDYAEADKLRARLALMGIESRIEKAKIGNATWNRVKMGPYTRSSSVSVIKKRLRNSGIDVIVTEVKS